MSNNRGSVSQKNHHSGQVRGSQSQGHHSSKPFIGIKGEGGGNPIPQKKFNNSLVSIPRRISQRTKCHQNEGKRVPIDSSLISYLLAKVNSFQGGQLSLHIHEWATLTTDATILQIISGECIEFISQPFDQECLLYIVHSGVTQRPLVLMHSPSHGLRKKFYSFPLFSCVLRVLQKII